MSRKKQSGLLINKKGWLLFAIFCIIVWIYVIWSMSSSVYNKRYSSSSSLLYKLPSFQISVESYHNAVKGLVYDNYKYQINEPPNRPTFFKLGDLLDEWSPYDTTTEGWFRSRAHPNKQSAVPRFDYSIERHRVSAKAYRDAELPFVLENVAAVIKAGNEVFTIDNLLEQFGDEKRYIEKSKNQHFLYYAGRFTGEGYPDWSPPQEDVEMSFPEYLRLCESAETTATSAQPLGEDVMTKCKTHKNSDKEAEGLEARRRRTTSFVNASLPHVLTRDEVSGGNNSRRHHRRRMQSLRSIEMSSAAVGEPSDGRSEYIERSFCWGRNQPSLHYLTIPANEGYSLSWLREAFPYFRSDEVGKDTPFFIVDHTGFKGINCRFGMRGVIAEPHYDGGRNMVAMLRGRKRYVLLPPEACSRLSLLPRGHPSARHASFDWADKSMRDAHPELVDADATEVVLSAGEVLYIPCYWFHYIISQDASAQCNARSGVSEVGRDALKQCGYY